MIKIKRDFLYIEHMDKGCHDQGILVDLHRLLLPIGSVHILEGI